MFKFQKARSTEPTDQKYIDAYTNFCNLGPRGTYDNLPNFIELKGIYDSPEDKYTRFLDMALTQLLDNNIIISLGNYRPSLRRNPNSPDYRNPISTHNSEEKVKQFHQYLQRFKVESAKELEELQKKQRSKSY